MSGKYEVDRRERGPWRPERGELIRIPVLGIAIPEWAGFCMVMSGSALLIILAILLAVL